MYKPFKFAVALFLLTQLVLPGCSSLAQPTKFPQTTETTKAALVQAKEESAAPDILVSSAASSSPSAMPNVSPGFRFFFLGPEFGP